MAHMRQAHVASIEASIRIDSHRFRVETRRDVIFGVCVGLKWWTSPQFELLSFAKRGKRERECKERLRGTFVKGAAAAKAGRAAEEAAPPQRAEKKQLSAKNSLSWAKQELSQLVCLREKRFFWLFAKGLCFFLCLSRSGSSPDQQRVPAPGKLKAEKHTHTHTHTHT